MCVGYLGGSFWRRSDIPLANEHHDRFDRNTIERALYGAFDAGGYRFLARSPGFDDRWLAQAEQLCTGFGERPASIACPLAIFARPFGRERVAVVQASDRGTDDAGRPGALGFYLLVLPRALYRRLGGDPFFLAQRFPPSWEARGVLPSFDGSMEPPPARTAAMLQKVLNVPNSATLLGGVQILLDGGRLIFERDRPDDAILRSLWALLPTRERAELWPASFAFSNAHGFDVLVVPRAADAEYEHFITEEKAGDYPEGRYESNIQSAIETGDQREIDSLLHYNRSHMLRLIVVLLVVVAVLSFAVNRLMPDRSRITPSSGDPRNTKPILELPPVEQCPSLSLRERNELSERLQALGKRWHIEMTPGATDEALTLLLAALDQRWDSTARHRDPRPLRKFGPIQRQLRVLLWKQGVADYNARGLNTVELLERLEKQLDSEPTQTEKGGDG